MIWRKVEDAPLDKAVLVWNGHTIAVGRQREYRQGRRCWFIDESFGFNEDGQILDVSHWMDLPSPPNGRSA